MGGLRADGPQVLHGNGPDPVGGFGPVGDRRRLVQAVPYLLSGRPQHRTPGPTPLAVLPGERHQPLVHLTRLSHANPRTVHTTQDCIFKCKNLIAPLYAHILTEQFSKSEGGGVGGGDPRKFHILPEDVAFFLLRVPTFPTMTHRVHRVPYITCISGFHETIPGPYR